MQLEIGPIFRAMTRSRARFILIVAEVALTLAIAANGITLILEARETMTRPSGFDEANLIRVISEPYSDALRDPERLAQLTREDLSALRAMPGVRSATNTFFTPWMGGGAVTEILLPGQELGTNTQFYYVDPSILDTLGIELVQGRNLSLQEYESAPPDSGYDRVQVGVLISQSLAKHLFPDGQAVGKTITYSNVERTHTIVGVFDKFYNPVGSASINEYTVFYPIPSGGLQRGTQYLVRADPGQASAVAAAIDGALLKVDDGRNVRVRTIAEMRQRFHDSDRLLVASLNAVMVLLVVVTALGIVGITSFSVTERRRQIGTRRALGATPAAIVRYFLVENWIVTTTGVVLGLGLAYALNYGLVTWVAGTRLDWRVLAPGVAFLWVLGLTAALGPALRGSRVPPAIATRNV
jgi:putative ABC transport system permease protein